MTSAPTDRSAEELAEASLPRSVRDDLGTTFDHVAIAAPRIRDLLPLWQDTLGGRFALGADNMDTGWRTVRLTFAGDMVIELIEPLGDAGLFDAFFRRNPRGGVHHVTFVVDDVTATRDRLAENGFEPFGFSADLQVFVHPRNASGVLVQFMRKHDHTWPPQTVDDVLAGRGINGTGKPSP